MTPRYRYYTATTLDGFLADDHDSLAWLLRQPQEKGGLLSYDQFISEIGTVVMGSTTYRWLLDHPEEQGPEPWPYQQPAFVFSHRRFDPVAEQIHRVEGDPSAVRDQLEQAAGDRDIWIVGGGDLAASFASAGMLDEIIVWIAPVLLGSGRPLFGGAFDLTLVESGTNGAFLCARYTVAGPLREGTQ